MKGEALPVAYRKPFGLSDLTLKLFGGHVLGSAQLRVTRNGVALGYSGDLCLEPTLTAEQAEVVECDVLVLESTFGLPCYVFPPKEEVLLQIAASWTTRSRTVRRPSSSATRSGKRRRS